MSPEDFFIDVSALPQTFPGLVQVITLGLFYGYGLCYASDLVSDGSELLLLIPSAAEIVGSVVLPVLGAVPDGFIVLFSGLGDDAANQLDVGIGALAGSTIMVLTVPWFLSIIGGRVNVDPQTKRAKYKSPKLLPPDNFSLDETGVSIAPAIRSGAKLMVITAVVYFVIQIPGILYAGQPYEVQAQGTTAFAFAALLLCCGFFVWYLYLQYSQKTKDVIDEAKFEKTLIEAIESQKITLIGIMYHALKEEFGEATEGAEIEIPPPPLAASRSNSSNTSSYNKRRSFQLQHDSSVGTGSTNYGSTSVSATSLPSEKTRTVSSSALARLERLLKPFFRRYDVDSSGTLEPGELVAVFRDLGENITQRQAAKAFNDMDINADGMLEFSEFVRGVAKYVLNTRGMAHRMSSNLNIQEHNEHAAVVADVKKQLASAAPKPPAASGITAIGSSRSGSGRFRADGSSSSGKGRTYQTVAQVEEGGAGDEDEEDDDEEEEEEDIPTDLADLSPEQQQRRILIRSVWMMTVGTALILLLSDPMVNVLTEIGVRTGIPPFYVSFVLAPLASNAPEVIASYNYSLKKTSTSIAIALTTLEGACVMNNTFVMGIFMFLIYYKDLEWRYSAETLAILFVILAMALMAQKRTHTVRDALMIIALYPASLLLVAGLESIGWK